MHPHSECPNWEYKNDPHHTPILAKEAAKILIEIYDGTLSIRPAALDTRPSHKELFSRLVPPKREYLAGNYRGQNFKCLKYCPVMVIGNQRVGSPPEVVHLDLQEFGRHIRAAVKGLDAVMALPDARISRKEKLKYLVAASCSLFSEFLLIHPYVNGNGHIARIMLTWILARFGYFLTEFPIEPRPKEPAYSDAIFRYQNGEFDPLENLVLLSIVSASSN
jgi:Fic/DOC family